MRYLIFVIDETSNSASSSEMAAINEFNSKLMREGIWVDAAGITSASNAKIIDNRDGVGAIINGSIFESKVFYSGFWIIEVDSDEIALEIALAGSAACNRKVELRPYL